MAVSKNSNMFLRQKIHDMINHIWLIIYDKSYNVFRKFRRFFEHYDQSYLIYKNSDNALFLWLVICDFFWKYNRTGIFNQSEIGNEHATNFQNKMYSQFQKI